MKITEDKENMKKEKGQLTKNTCNPKYIHQAADLQKKIQRKQNQKEK